MVLRIYEPFADRGRAGQDGKDPNLPGGQVQSPGRPPDSHTKVENICQILILFGMSSSQSY